VTNPIRNVSRTGARSIQALLGRSVPSLSAATLIASTVTTPSTAQGEYVRDLPPDYTEPVAGPPPPACVTRLRSLGSPVEFRAVLTRKDGAIEPFASGRLFRAGPAQPYSNLAAAGRSVTVYLDGFVCLEETSQRSISAFRAQCRGDDLVGSDTKGTWVLSFHPGSPRSN
jgi:hypothetical protein